MLLRHNINLVGKLLLQSREDVLEQAVQDIEDLVVVLVDSHLEIETHELGHVSVRIRVLGTEDRGDLVHSLHITSDTHLLSELRRLRKEGGAWRKLIVRLIEHVSLPLKYCTLKTLAPDSVAAPCSFGVWISMKPWELRYSRKRLHTADDMRKMAWFVGVCALEH